VSVDSAAPATAASWVGRPVRRREDRRLITGAGRYIEDLSLPGTVWATIVRSPFANATIEEIDLAAAREAPDVVACFSGAELMEDWCTSLPCVSRPTEDVKAPPRWPLTPDKARHVGDALAVVVAETRAAAKDAADLVFAGLDPLPAVTDVEEALAEGAPLVHDELGDNRCYTWNLLAGDPAAAFERAEVTISERYRQQRLIINAMENRGVLAAPEGDGGYALWSSTQCPHMVRTTIAATTGIPEARLRVIAPDVGGGFGGKVQVYAEEALCLGLARRLGRPVKWIEERSEGHLAVHGARDMVQYVELAASAEGRIEALRVRLFAAMGAYLGLGTPSIPLLGASIYTGCYDIQNFDCEVVGVFTHTTMTDAYRGAGRPEATYAIERAIEALAHKIGRDPLEVRRLNFHKSFPATMACGQDIDAGDFDGCLDRALELLDLPAVRAEQAERLRAGDPRRLGVGFSSYIEMAGLSPSRANGAAGFAMGGWESATVRVLSDGSVQALTGLSPHGQGTATTFAQIVADQLGLSPQEVELVHGDTGSVAFGTGTFGSRGVVVGGSAMYFACRRLLERARPIAAHMLGVDEAEARCVEGAFEAGGERVSLREPGGVGDLAEGSEPVLEASCNHDPATFSWPSGTYAVLVEVDTETGAVDLRRVVAVDDVGVVVNPMLVHGQVHGALAQGLAQALWEGAIYDEDGNLENGSLMNYMVPVATELPFFELGSVETPSTTNPLGTKGAGEAGTIAAPPAVVNAALDALRPLGVTHLDMPLTPERVWRAIGEARG